MIELILPLLGPVTQDPSPRHPAVDQACILGTPVKAISNGYGSFSWSHEKGWTFTQETPEGKISMSHLKYKGVNRFYTIGEVVSACGNTGAYSTGPHIHVEAPPHILKRLYYNL